MRIAIIASIIVVLGCGENPMEPNTDIGFRVWADVAPRSVSLRDTTIALRIRVYVANPTNHEIRVMTASDPSKSVGLWGRYRIMDPSGAMRGGPATDWFGQSEYVIGPRKSDYLESFVPLKAWIKGDLKVGTYTIRAWFNTREGESVRFTVTP